MFVLYVRNSKKLKRKANRDKKKNTFLLSIYIRCQKAKLTSPRLIRGAIRDEQASNSPSFFDAAFVYSLSTAATVKRGERGL